MPLSVVGVAMYFWTRLAAAAAKATCKYVRKFGRTVGGVTSIGQLVNSRVPDLAISFVSWKFEVG